MLDMAVCTYKVPVCLHACPQSCMSVSFLLLYDDLKQKGFD